MKKREQKESADEKMLGKVIAAELRQQLREAESDCPETEIVAAFYDRTLSDREKKIWEKHFLKCLRCQEYLAEIARLSDADEALPLHHEDGEYEASDQSGGWFYRLAWVVPFLIIGVLSAVWYRDEVSRYVGIPREPSSNVSEPAPAEEQPRPEAKAQAKGYQAKAGNAVAPNVTGTRKAPAGRESQAGATGTGVMAALRDRAEMAAARKEKNETAGGEVAENRPRPTAPVPVPAAAEEAARQSEAVEAGSANLRKEAAPLGGITIRGAQQKVETKWRVGRRGTIQKADGSGGWTRIASGVDEDLFDITFEGSTGWAVGHSGTVLRSPDGGDTWQKVTAPTSEDLIHVSSQGPQQATVISRSGKNFSTSNGGQTWK